MFNEKGNNKYNYDLLIIYNLDIAINIIYNVNMYI